MRDCRVALMLSHNSSFSTRSTAAQVALRLLGYEPRFATLLRVRAHTAALQVGTRARSASMEEPAPGFHVQRVPQRQYGSPLYQRHPGSGLVQGRLRVGQY